MASLLPQRVYQISLSGKAEDFEQYKPGGLHPIHIGDMLKDQRYRIVHKLGFGSYSTVWLARDTLQHCYVSLKISRADFPSNNNELKVLRYLANCDNDHTGSQFVMKLRDDFVIDGPNGNHQCLVAQVAGRRLARPAGVSHACLGPARLLASQLFQGVEYLHSCNIGHGDLYTGNIILQLDNFDSWSDEQVYACLGAPYEEKLFRIDGKPIEKCAPTYVVHPGNLFELEEQVMLAKVLIIDFGQAYFIDNPPKRVSTPSQFSAPELLVRTGVSPATDIWALGCNTFEICAGYTLFKALFLPRQDVMKDIVAMLGKPPDSIWDAWDERGNYFDPDGRPIKASEQSISVQPYPLYDRIHDLAWLYPREGKSRDSRLRGELGNLATAELVQLHKLLSKIFLFDPESRMTLSDALSHPFLALINLSKL